MPALFETLAKRLLGRYVSIKKRKGCGAHLAGSWEPFAPRSVLRELNDVINN
jgi:hypothetical protein